MTPSEKLAFDALKVLCLTPGIRAFLQEFDPKALRQAEDAANALEKLPRGSAAPVRPPQPRMLSVGLNSKLDCVARLGFEDGSIECVSINHRDFARLAARGVKVRND